jgi:hypothetical protein
LFSSSWTAWDAPSGVPLSSTSTIWTFRPLSFAKSSTAISVPRIVSKDVAGIWLLLPPLIPIFTEVVPPLPDPLLPPLPSVEPPHADSASTPANVALTTLHDRFRMQLPLSSRPRRTDVAWRVVLGSGRQRPR